MPRGMVLFAALVSTVALAQGHEPAEPRTEPEHTAAAGPHSDQAVHEGVDEEEHDTAKFIIHHLVDANQFTFDIPLTNHALVWHLPVILIPLKPGACPANPAEASLTKGCLDLSVTKHTLMMWLAAVVLILVFLLGAHRNKKELVPQGPLANFLELLVLFVRDEMAIKNIGKEEGPRYTSFLLSIFFFILFMNLWGLFPWMSAATGNIAVTVSLAFCTFILTQAGAIRVAGFGAYLKHLTGGVHWALWPIMIPVEFLGLFTKPFALTIRLFANMLAGHIVIFFLLGLIFILNHPLIAAVSVPFAIGIYFLEIFVAFVQAYIFAMLSSLFIGMGVAVGHHDDHDAHHEKHASSEHGPEGLSPEAGKLPLVP